MAVLDGRHPNGLPSQAEKDFQHCRKMVDDAVRQAAGATSLKNDEQWATKVQRKAL